MEIEQKQVELVRRFVDEAQCAGISEAVGLIVDATSHSSLFAFSEILSVPNIQQLNETEYSMYLDLLRLFAHGIWTDYKNNAASLPSLEPDQVRKLKQLTVLTLAETAKVLPYILLMQQLDVSNVRELEDFLINECMYSGIVKGKLDQRRCCFEVQFAAGRDLRPGQLENMIQTLATWLTTSENLLLTIQEKIKWADNMSELDRRHKKEVEEKADEMRNSIKKENKEMYRSSISLCRSQLVDVFFLLVGRSYSKCNQAGLDLRGQQEIVYSESGGVMEYEEDRVCPKRRRQHGC